jgi:hypothetical protein
MRFFRSVGVLLVIILVFTAFSAFDCGDNSKIVTINISPTSGITLTYDPPDGNTTQAFTASVTYDDGTSDDGTDKVDWESENETIAAFTDNVLHPMAVGSTRVRATAESGDVFTSWYNVTVKPPFTVLGGSASANDDTLDIGSSTLLTMIASIDEDDNGSEDSTEIVTSITTWTIDGASTGDGDIDGNEFTATDAGDVIITGTFDDGQVTLSDTVSDSVTITVLPPVSVTLTADPTSVNFSGTDDSTVNLTAVPSGDTPTGYSWTTTGGTLDSTDTTGATNELYVNWENAGDSITIGVTAHFDGADASDSDDIMVAAAQGPAFDDMTVNGSTVANGANAGEFAAGEGLTVVASATDPDGGTVSYSWSSNPAGAVSPTTGANVTVTQNTPDTTTVVTCTVSDDNGGDNAERSFSFDATLAPPQTDEMRLRAVAPDGAGEIKILMETGEMSSPRLGVTFKVNYDGSKVSASGPGDVQKDDANPWGSGLELYFPQLNPSDITFSGFTPTTDGGPVVSITYTVDSGSGSTTDFTFVEADSQYAEPDGTTFVPAAVYTNALGVQVP